ncbi:uS10/mL48 family ribosomal protein [Haloplanus halobius]|uniref:uS10/mL48 family ribosomal protein n=1 Tax=Haloplanus halobius TaxID=2934938 RepID=UPI002010C572|nr:uS10/mL48 family ribosomal protein [Haloplanus sp. XH21]
MAFVTKLTFQSGDREALESLVTDIKRMVERKGAECKGPHSSPPERFSVPQYRTLQPGDQFTPWDYTVYSRRLEIHGNDDVARRVGHMEFPESVHVEIEVDRKKPLGQGNT